MFKKSSVSCLISPQSVLRRNMWNRIVSCVVGVPGTKSGKKNCHSIIFIEMPYSSWPKPILSWPDLKKNVIYWLKKALKFHTHFLLTYIISIIFFKRLLNLVNFSAFLIASLELDIWSMESHLKLISNFKTPNALTLHSKEFKNSGLNIR